MLDSILDKNGRFDLFSGYLTGCFDSFVMNDQGVLQVNILKIKELIIFIICL